jgi:hypothetical protein
MVPKISRCTVDMLRQILYDKTIDVGKLSAILIYSAISAFFLSFSKNRMILILSSKAVN